MKRSSRSLLPKTYEPAAYEDKVYAAWEKSKAFRPISDTDPKQRAQRKPYTIVMPPPNATGILHTGHAIMLAIEDALIRYHRMKGFDTLYLPGTDHAAIATASVVDRQLLDEGTDRHTIGRKRFEARAAKLADQNRQRIRNQIRALGASADWSRDAFTLDTDRKTAVVTAFQRLYRNGLIYRDSYMVNWCPACRTVLADDEVEHVEQEGVLYYMKYGPFTLATTRPETKVGDTAVAVHPRDKRYRKYIGKSIDVQTITGARQLTVIADEMVDPEFGTGVVKITPFHDANDYQVYLRHPNEAGPPLEVIGEDGTMTKAAGAELVGLDRFAARKKMVAWLKREKLLVKEELHRHSVGRCYRSDDVIEPRISKQWFVKVSAIKEQAIRFVDTGQLKFVPQRFEKTYRQWLENLHDWCISRQVWFGHPVPVYLKGDQVSLTKRAGFTASDDTLDTWFSSALWPFSTLGWPKQTADFKRFFPSNVLETGYDIIPFWISRMVLMTIALDVRDPKTKELKPPFHTAYLHGLVRDQRGRKFSKSLGNGVDPLELVGKYGADALRFMLATSSSPGGDMRFDEARVVAARNFANKLWNISRFILAQDHTAADLAKLDSDTLTTFDAAILHRLRETAVAVEGALYDPDNYDSAGRYPEPPAGSGLPAYELGQAGNRLQEFIWADFADWYLEAAKIQLADPATKHNTAIILQVVLEAVLKLLHPLMPFITETIWQDGLGKSKPLITSSWPELHQDLNQPDDWADFTSIRTLVERIRNERVRRKIPAGSKIRILLLANQPDAAVRNFATIKRLARLKDSSEIIKSKPINEASRKVQLGMWTVYIPDSELLNALDDSSRLQAERDTAKMEVERLSNRLANKAYVTKAPAHVVTQTKRQLKEARQRLRQLGG